MSKKPAKKPVDSPRPAANVERPGKPVRYIGIGKVFSCVCGRSFSRGMLYEHNGERYCSRKCIPS